MKIKIVFILLLYYSLVFHMNFQIVSKLIFWNNKQASILYFFKCKMIFINYMLYLNIIFARH